MEFVASNTAACSNATRATPLPTVPAEDDTTGIPKVGMEFNSADDGKDFYNEYARRMGFGIRVGHSYSSRKDKTVISRTFECVKSGFPNGVGKNYNNRRPRAILRVGCKAMMMIKKKESGKWVICKFEKAHCHELESPSKVHLIRSHRHISSSQRRLINTFDKVGIPPRRMTSMSIEECGGAMNDGFIMEDCRTLLRTERQWTFGNDAQRVLEYFKRKQFENPTFFYAIQVDEDERLTNVFWVDVRSRMAYEYFGDVVTFDTTYKTNQFRLPFASFTGLNHHGQSVLFGCALIANESEASFIWLFETWLVVMHGRHPVSILTDYDKAITAAVKHVFPNTNHRFCMRHIQKKKLDKLFHVMNQNETFDGDFHKCIYETETREEFEKSWHLLLNKYNLNNDDWLNSLYGIRQQWVPLYLKDKFFADMSTAQQRESMNLFFDGYVTSKTTLQTFVGQYEKALESHYEKELEADFNTRYAKPLLTSTSIMELQAAEFYTRKVFLRFQDEFNETWHYVAKKCDEVDEGIATYKVTRYGHDDRSYHVTFIASEVKASCSCKMFEFSGIPCRHLLLVFRMEGVLQIPPHYFLTRWSRNAKRSGVVNDNITLLQSSSHESFLLRFNNLCLEAVKCAEEGSSSTRTYKFALGVIQECKKIIISAKESFEKEENLVDGSCQGDKLNEVNKTNTMMGLNFLLDHQRNTGKGYREN